MKQLVYLYKSRNTDLEKPKPVKKIDLYHHSSATIKSMNNLFDKRKPYVKRNKLLRYNSTMELNKSCTLRLPLQKYRENVSQERYNLLKKFLYLSPIEHLHD